MNAPYQNPRPHPGLDTRTLVLRYRMYPYTDGGLSPLLSAQAGHKAKRRVEV
jgi:hypothetical protein